MNLSNLIRQHVDIRDEIKYINEVVDKSSIELNTMDIASRINKLAGKLQVHLMSEDKFLYPSLINGKDLELREMATLYMDEMGEISEVFKEYKNKFNTKNKIEANKEGFFQETKIILKEIEERIDKEENGLYKLIISK
ncbi:MAG: hemerythrin domain-containing protein [Clostridium sp.]